MKFLRIRNWDKWQSYRADRGQPPWIKVHRRLMRNPEWVSLTDAQRGQLVSIWLLGADKGGVIPASAQLIQKLCYMETEPDLQLFVSLGFIEGDTQLEPERRHDDATMTPERRQDDRPEAEERRGEENVCSEPKDDSEPPAHPILFIPLVDKTKYPIFQEQINEWTESFPAVNVLQQLRKIREWNISNPKKQKTKKGIRRHITGWLSDEQDKGGQLRRAGNGRDAPAPAPPEPNVVRAEDFDKHGQPRRKDGDATAKATTLTGTNAKET